MKNKALRLLAIFALVLVTACSTKGEDLLQEGENLLYNGRHREAVRLFLEVVDRYPNTLLAETALLRTGEIFYLSLSEPEKAVEYFQQVMHDYPNTEQAGQAGEYIASIYEDTFNDYDSAVIQYQKLIDEGDGKRRDRYQFAIARCFYHKGDYQQAITEFENLKKKYPTSDLIPNADYMIGNCYFVMNKCDKALEVYSKLLTASPDIEWKFDIKISTAVCMEDKEEYGQALHIYRELMDAGSNEGLIQKKIDAVLERIKDKNR